MQHKWKIEKGNLKRAFSIVLISLIPFLLIGIARYFQLLEIIELKTLDKRWQLADLYQPPSQSDLVLVTIDSETEELLGSRFFWSPRDYRPFIATLQQANPAAILLMIWLNREWPEDQEILPGKSLMVLRPYYTSSSHWRRSRILQVAKWAPVISNLADAEVKSFSNFPLDASDGIYRTAQLVVKSRSGLDYHKSLELHAVLRKWGIPAETLQLRRSFWFGWQLRSTLSDGSIKIPLDDRGRMWIRYTDKRDAFETISAVDMLSLYEQAGEAAFREKFADKIILVGVTTGNTRPALTPRGRLDALEMRANAINTLLNRDFITRYRVTADLAYLLLCAAIVTAIAEFAYIRGKGTAWILTRNGFVLGMHILWTLVAFVFWHWWIDLTGPTLAIATSAGITALHLGYLRLGRLFRELRSTQQQLVRSEKEAAYGAMAAQVRHEIRNILNAIRSPAEMVRNNFERDDPLQLGQHPEEIVAEMNVIIERVTKLNEMIENELSFFQNSHFRFEFQELDAIIQDSIEMARDVIQASHIQVDKHISPEHPHIEVDADKLKIALLNLIRNACEAMSEEGTLGVHAKQEGTNCVIQVSDTGRGISPSDLEQIFEPFFTTKARGLGLGLANVRNIVEGHGGTIHVESLPGMGTTFILQIPMRQAADWRPGEADATDPHSG